MIFDIECDPRISIVCINWAPGSRLMIGTINPHNPVNCGRQVLTVDALLIAAKGRFSFDAYPYRRITITARDEEASPADKRALGGLSGSSPLDW